VRRLSPGLRGVLIGHAEAEGGRTGVTAVRFEAPAAVVVDVRGGASATYDTASLSLEATFGLRWALFLAGGSLFGLDAAAGVRQHVLDTGGGVAVFGNPHRIAPVSGAALFDLPATEGPVPDYRALGREAARRATSGAPATGRVGAGAGATVGKYLGRAAASPGGIGWAERRLPEGGRVASLVAVNSVGAVRDPSTGRWVAGARGAGGRVVPPPAQPTGTPEEVGTTLGIVITELELARPVLARVAAMASAALGAVVVPCATATDGDVLFVAATGRAGRPTPEARPGHTADAVGAAAGAVVTEAVLTAVRTAAAPAHR
jgi:L-aminopeptidase/D-esterase-like protein